MIKELKYFSLFSGIGGFEIGINDAYEINNQQQSRSKKSKSKKLSQGREWLSKQSGSHLCSSNGTTPHCVGYSEIDKYAIRVYESHFPNHKNYGDITKIKEKELPNFDLLVGGFPCQSFSIAGKRGGFADTRGTLFFDIARILREKKPRLCLLENVKGLLSHDGGRTFRTIISTLDELGYDLQWQVLNSKNHGVPHNRERIIIVGHLRGTPRPQVFPFSEENSISQDLQKERWISPTQTAWQFRNWSGAHIDMGLDTARQLTPIECERAQGFPDNWTQNISDNQRYKCLGNAVTTHVIRDVVRKII